MKTKQRIQRTIQMMALLALCLLFPGTGEAADSSSFAPSMVTWKDTAVRVGTVITWPASSMPNPPEMWLECNGQSIPGSSEFSLLRAVLGKSTVPNYNNGQFLRGATAGYGQQVADSTRTHTHNQPTHTHTFNLGLSSTALTGQAAGQKYTDNHTGLDGRGVETGPEPSQSFVIDYVKDLWVEDATVHTIRETKMQNAWLQTSSKTAASSSVSGNLLTGDVTGSINQAGGDQTYLNDDNRGIAGGVETAPQHTKVKYVIKARY